MITDEVNADERGDAYHLSDSEFPSISLRPKWRNFLAAKLAIVCKKYFLQIILF